MTDLIEELSEHIYRAYLEDIQTTSMQEIWTFVTSSPNFKLFSGSEDIIKFRKGDMMYFNINFIRIIYTAIISKIETEYNFKTKEDDITHKNQIWVYVIFCFYTE